MLFETAAVQVGRKNKDPFPDFLDGLGNFVEGRGQGLDVFAFERCDERLAELFGQFLRDLFILAPAVDEFVEALRRFVMFEFAEKRDEMVDAAVGLLRAGFEQIEKLFVVAEKLADREHKILL
jgi:hypothetical protein